jgi:integrase
VPTLTRPKVVEVDFARALLASTEGVAHDMILTALHGFRKREIMGLRVEQLQLARDRVVIDNQLYRGRDKLPKGEKPRLGILCPTLVRRLQLRAEHTDGYVFLQEPHHESPGEPFGEGLMTKVFNRAWEAIGERPYWWSWHVLRHTFATTLRVGGVSQFVIDELMGHEADGMPALYQHVLDEEFDHAIEVIETAFGGVVAATRETSAAEP